MQTITCKVIIPADRRLHITVPGDVPPGPAEVMLVIAPKVPAEKGLTAGDLLRSPLCGVWEDRVDISDSIAFARSLRARA
jgi:hypothetical protein